AEALETRRGRRLGRKHSIHDAVVAWGGSTRHATRASPGAEALVTRTRASPGAEALVTRRGPRLGSPGAAAPAIRRPRHPGRTPSSRDAGLAWGGSPRHATRASPGAEPSSRDAVAHLGRGRLSAPLLELAQKRIAPDPQQRRRARAVVLHRRQRAQH